MPKRKTHRHRPEAAAQQQQQHEHEDDETEMNGNGGVEDLLEQLLEQRYTTREAALKALAKSLCSSYSFDLVDKSRTTIAEGLKRSFKKGRDAEQQLASQVLSLVVLTLGVESDDMFSELQPILNTMLKDFEDGVSFTVLNEAITALAMLYFVSCTDELATRDFISLLETIFTSTVTSLHTNAIKAWTLLLTTVPSTYITTKIFPKNISTLYSMLDTNDVDTRMAVGEAIAFLLAVLRQSVEEKEETFDLHDYDKHVNTDDLVDKIKEFANSSNRQAGKKERQKQKGHFKHIIQSILDGDVPEEVLTINDQKITFAGWRHHIQLNFVRGCLAEGTQQHLENNALLQEIFEFSLVEGGGKQHLSKVEKRLFLSPNSGAAKARTKARNVDRNRFGRVAQSFSEDD